MLKACPKCKRVDEGKKCKYCDVPLSSDWKGLVIVINPEGSIIAEKVNNQKGMFALKVRRG